MPDDQLDAPMTIHRWGALLLCHPHPTPSPPLESSLVISHCSDNVDSVLSYSPLELLCHPLSSILERTLPMNCKRSRAEGGQC